MENPESRAGEVKQLYYIFALQGFMYRVILYFCPSNYKRISIDNKTYKCSHQVGPLTQGPNSGVALFDLACLRQSKVSQKVTADYETILFDL